MEILLYAVDTIASTTNQLVGLNLTQTIIIVSGFVITALGIIFNPTLSLKFNRLKRNIDAKFQEILTSNNNQYDIIKSELSGVKIDIFNVKVEIEDHNKFISKYISEKSVINCLEFVVSDALKYIQKESDDSINNFIAYISNIYINMFKEVMGIGVDDLSEEILLNKIKMSENKIFNNKYDFVPKNYLKLLNKCRLNNEQTNKLIHELLQITHDQVNSKIERLRNIAENYMQNLMRDIIITWNEFKFSEK